MTKRSFPDINVWFALAVADHPHHGPATDWWSKDASIAGFCRITQIGLLRLLTTSAAMDGKPLTNRQAWKVYDAFLQDSRVQLFSDIPALEDRFRSGSDTRMSSPRLWVDSYLAAFATAHDATLVTFDRGCRQYGVPTLILEAH